MSMHDRSTAHLPHADEAKTALGEPLFRYMMGKPFDGDVNADANEAAFRRYSLVPRVMSGADRPDLSLEFCGRRFAAPIVAGAFAGDRVFHADGLLPIASVCRDLNLPLVISEETVTPLAEICSVHKGAWLQLRAAGPLERIKRLADHAAEVGAMGLVLTVLAPVHPVQGLQPGSFSIGQEIANRGWSTIGSEGPGVQPLDAFPAWSWKEIAAVAGHLQALGLPLLVKGVLRAEDAAAAIDAGCAGVIASNIGLRQSARWTAALHRLPSLKTTRGALLHDGGVRYGSDIVTACALGADLSIVVRPLICALAAGGEEAVKKYLRGLIDETLAMASWCGVERLTELDGSFLTTEGMA